MLVVLLSFLLSAASAQDRPAREAQPSVQERAVDEQHDFGEVLQGTETTATFTVTNPTRQAAAITAPEAPAGLRFVLPEEPVAPGGSATVTVILSGDRSVDDNVVFHVGTHMRVIRIKGNVLPKPAGGAPTTTGGPVLN